MSFLNSAKGSRCWESVLRPLKHVATREDAHLVRLHSLAERDQRVAQEMFPVAQHRRVSLCAMPHRTTSVCSWLDHRDDDIQGAPSLDTLPQHALQISGAAPVSCVQAQFKACPAESSAEVCNHVLQRTFGVGEQQNVLFVTEAGQHHVVASPRTTCQLQLRPVFRLPPSRTPRELPRAPGGTRRPIEM